MSWPYGQKREEVVVKAASSLAACSPALAATASPPIAAAAALETSALLALSYYRGGSSPRLAAAAAATATLATATIAYPASLAVLPPAAAMHAAVAIGVPVAAGAHTALTRRDVKKPPREPPRFTLGFTTPTGDLVMVPPEDVIDLLASHAVTHGGKLEMVFLNGCYSEPLARALHAAGMPYVLCWKTKVEDGAAKLAITTFFREMNAGKPFESAFSAAKRALLFTTRAGKNACGLAMQVPKYEIKDPEGRVLPAESRSTPACTPPPIKTGLCLLLTPNGEFSW